MNVHLHALGIKDHILMQKRRCDHEMTKYLGGNAFFVSRGSEKVFVESKIADDLKGMTLGVYDRETDQLIGYGKKAAGQLPRFLFGQYPTHKCIGCCFS
jgi:hypothetical protein